MGRRKLKRVAPVIPDNNKRLAAAAAAGAGGRAAAGAAAAAWRRHTWAKSDGVGVIRSAVLIV